MGFRRLAHCHEMSLILAAGSVWSKNTFFLIKSLHRVPLLKNRCVSDPKKYQGRVKQRGHSLVSQIFLPCQQNSAYLRFGTISGALPRLSHGGAVFVAPVQFCQGHMSPMRMVDWKERSKIESKSSIQCVDFFWKTFAFLNLVRIMGVIRKRYLSLYDVTWNEWYGQVCTKSCVSTSLGWPRRWFWVIPPLEPFCGTNPLCIVHNQHRHTSIFADLLSVDPSKISSVWCTNVCFPCSFQFFNRTR